MSTGKMFMAQMSRHLPISSNCPAFSGMEKYKGPTRPISFSFNPFSNFFLLSMTRMGGSCSKGSKGSRAAGPQEKQGRARAAAAGAAGAYVEKKNFYRFSLNF